MTDRTISPAIKEFSRLDIPVPEQTLLPSGVRLVSLCHGDQDINRLTISWNKGTADMDNPAALEILAELIREGCTGMTGAQLSEIIDFNGSWLRIDAQSHYTVLTLHSLNSRFQEVISTVVDMITSPTLPEREFETVREKLANARALAEKKVAYHADCTDRRMVFGATHPMARTVTADSLRATKHAEIRQVYEDVFRATPPVAFLAGNITPDVQSTATAALSRIKFRSDAERKTVIIPMTPDNICHKTVTDLPESLQSAVKISIPAIPRTHPDYNNLRLTTMALGGYFGSRLMTNIREDKGYTYGISAGVSGYPEGGVITIESQCDNHYTMPLIEEVKKELIALTDTDMSQEELTHVRRFAMTSLAAMLDTPFTIMDYYINQRHYGTPANYFSLQQDAIIELTPAIIKEMAYKYLDIDNLYISIAGSKKQFTKQ